MRSYRFLVLFGVAVGKPFHSCDSTEYSVASGLCVQRLWHGELSLRRLAAGEKRELYPRIVYLSHRDNPPGHHRCNTP